MSEILDASAKQKQELALKLYSEPPLHYVKQQAAQQYEFLFCVEIPWPLLRLWANFSDDSTHVKVSYIDLLNSR